MITAILAFLATVGLAVVNPAPASAGFDPYLPNDSCDDRDGKFCYSYFRQSNGPFGGGRFETHLNNMTVGSAAPAGTHISTVMWLAESSSRYIEVGIEQGYMSPNGPIPNFTTTIHDNVWCPDGCWAYYLYWADTVNGYQHKHIIQPLSPTGETVTFVVEKDRYSSENDWLIHAQWPGGSRTGVSTFTDMNAAYYINWGGEFSGLSWDPGSCADKFEIHGWVSPLQQWGQWNQTQAATYSYAPELGAAMLAPWTWVWWKPLRDANNNVIKPNGCV